MKRMPPSVVAGLGTAVVWLITGAIPWPGRVVTALIVGALPVLAVAQLRIVQDPRDLPRMAAYASTIVMLWGLAVLSGLAAWASGFRPVDLYLTPIGAGRTLLWAGGMTAAAVGMGLALRLAGFHESGFVRHLLPQTRKERLTFAGLRFTAGITEEFVFRGFLLAMLATATGSVTAAVIIATVIFGWVHAYQQLGGAVRAGILGALLALPPLFTGSAIPSMIAHTCIDLIGGLWLRERGRS